MSRVAATFCAECFVLTIIGLLVRAGASIGFFQGDVRKLVSDDLPALKPTFMAGLTPALVYSCEDSQRKIKLAG